MPIKEWGKLHSTAEKNWVKKTARWKQMCYLLSKKWSNKATYLLLLQKNCSCINTEQKGERYCRLKAELKFAFPRYHFPYFLLYLLSKGSTSLSYRLENSIYDSWKSKEVNSNYTYISKKTLWDYFSLTYHTICWHLNTPYCTLGIWLKSRITTIFCRWWPVFDPLPTFLCLVPQVLLWDGASLIRHSIVFLWRCVAHFQINTIVLLVLWVLTRVLTVWMGCIIFSCLHFW